MRITTTKEKILNAVSLVERVVGKKETLPVLSCVLIDVGKTISVRATNLEAGIDVVVPGEIEEKGMIAVPAAILSQTLKSTNGDKVTFKDEEENLLVEARGARTVVKAVPHNEFPSIQHDVGGGNTVMVSRERLLEGIQSVVYAASPSMIRPELGSVYVSISSKELICVATDSFRLAEKRILGASADDVEADVLIPLKHAVELSHILDRIEDESIQLSLDESQLSIQGSGVSYTSRVVDGTFPNYKEIIPKKTTSEATVLRGDLIEVLRKARVFSGAEQHVGLHIYPKKKLFSVTARSGDVGEMSDSIDAALEGDDLDINFHIGYLTDCLPGIGSDSVVLSFGGVGKPLIIRGASDNSFTYLVMPLNR